MRTARIFGLIGAPLAASILLTGCFFAKPQVTQYYVLDYLPTPPMERLEKGPFPFVVRVRDCNISETYRRSQIVYRQSANQMQFYGLHLWAVDPDRMIGDLMVKHLKAAKLFDNVTRAVENYVPDFLMSCDIQAIEEYDSKDQWYAHLTIEYKLEDAKTNHIVWKKLYDLRKSVPQQEPVFIVRELSFLNESINERMVKELEIVLDEAKHKAVNRADSAVVDTTTPKAKP
ncbi:MAG: PqiC family protein [Fibrobacterota bacterium]|nr:PqiC family protein [Fibrobacterota bacterium]